MQMGFVHESNFCTGCKTCVIACKDKHESAVGENFRRVSQFEGGGFAKAGDAYVQNVYTYSISISCNHCAEPKCVQNCPTGAMHKDADTGIVSVNQDICIGCGYCAWSCPYGAPQMNKKKGVMGKCDMCRDLLDEGKDPACVAACPLHLLHCGDIEKLREEFQGTATCKVMPDPELTHPSVIVVPHKNAL
jgi:anaerobic dimethyl sulfoxide reductase subunit B